jgi:hypothetical protein
MADKDLNRHKHSTWLLLSGIFLIVNVVIMGYVDKITPDFNLALGAILAYLGNHTYQNYRTAPQG